MSEETKTCPYCSEKIPVDAVRCEYCGEVVGYTSGSNNNTVIEENKTNQKSTHSSSTKKLPKYSHKFCQRCGAPALYTASLCNECGAILPQYLLKREVDSIQGEISFIQGSNTICQIMEFIGISATVYYCLAGGEIVDLAYGICSGILAVYFRIKRIHNCIEVQRLKKQIGQ